MERAAEAARAGDISYFISLDQAELRRLCSKRDDDGRSLLHSAVAGGRLDLLQYLLEYSSTETIDAVDLEGWSPLISACSCGHELIAKLLLSRGADPNRATHHGRTALHYAASKGHIHCVTLLLGSGALATVKDGGGATPLHRAAAVGNVDAVRALLNLASPKAILDARDFTGSTPLLLAAAAGHRGTALLLTARGADVEAENNEEETPLGAAATFGGLREAMVELATGEKTLDDFHTCMG